ncbi:MAG: hypothetical protein WC239_02400 [Sphaerochaetaceae bacterium]|jgi:hypothetical protein
MIHVEELSEDLEHIRGIVQTFENLINNTLDNARSDAYTFILKGYRMLENALIKELKQKVIE